MNSLYNLQNCWLNLSLLTICVSLFIRLNIIRVTLTCFDFAVTHHLQGDYNNDTISQSFIKCFNIK